ncbi:MAG TPA: histidine kinase, partial [Nakamurella sp.]
MLNRSSERWCTGGALDLDRAREDHETLRRLEDRERIAADLHDHVIQELFATGMGLQGLVGQLTR